MSDKNKAKEEEVCLDEGAKESIHQFRHLTWIGAIVLLVDIACAYIAPRFFPTDQYVLVKASLLRIPIDLRHGFMLLSTIVLLDLLSPHPILAKASSTPMSSAILIVGVVGSLAYVMAG